MVLPSILRPESHVVRLCAAVDDLERGRSTAANSPRIVEHEALGELCAHPPVVEVVKQLMREHGNGREDCGMHHMHASRHSEGEVEARWHHDCTSAARPLTPSMRTAYDSEHNLRIFDLCGGARTDNCVPSVHDRAQLSIHVFYYFAGCGDSVQPLRCASSSSQCCGAARG